MRTSGQSDAYLSLPPPEAVTHTLTAFNPTPVQQQICRGADGV